MQIASALAGFTLGEADMLRKAMGKKKAEVMAAQMDQFLKGCAARGVAGEEGAARSGTTMEQFAGYGFNKSHSAAYAWLAYQTAYLKANYPAEFMAALLTSERANTDKMVQYIGECREMGIRVLPAGRQPVRHVLHGRAGREARATDIRFGLAAIKNVGEGAVEAVLAARRERRPLPVALRLLRARRPARREPARDRELHQERLLRLDSTRGARRSSPRSTARWRAGQKRQRDREQGQASLFGAAGGRRRRRRRPTASRTSPPWGEAERLAFEKESLGFFISGHPLERFRAELAQWASATTGDARAAGRERRGDRRRASSRRCG